MRVRVLVPGVLRGVTDGAAHLDVDVAEPATLGALFDVLAVRYPLLERRLRTERAELRRYVNVYVDGEECRRIGGAGARLAEDAEVLILPSIAGG
ncbi:MoaD/ThiS family protein [Umezawaea beigongshangensis]|uniref:MoaD/ThiS family protein n=1 Tax=Umezawaea beigongshangensis TaxID=2780383 RepID=UPI0018F23C06|nr:MoaD/ThiS family protein [Umezawaea beigongshangensis]